MRAILVLLIAALCPLAFALPKASAEPRVLRVRALGEPQTLDWNLASTWVEGLIIRNIMEGLVAIDSQLGAVPALAQSWSTSHENKVYTFHIKKTAKWSDGVPVRAEDFVASWKRLLAPETHAKYASFLFDIEGAEAFHKGEVKDFAKVGVKALDDHTLQVKLRAPIAYWHFITTFYATYPIRADQIANKPTQWQKPGTMVSAGPFVLGSHEAGRSIILTRNPVYHGSRGNIDQIAVALVADDSTALKLYEDGRIDFLAKVASLERSRLKARKDFRTWPDLRVVHLRLNTSRNPMGNIHLRRAVALAIDRSKLTGLFEGAYNDASSFVPPGMLGYSQRAGMEFNIEKAKAELKKSGLDASKLPALDLLTPSFDDQVILAQFIQDELKRNLGLNVRIHILEPKRYYSPALAHNDYAMQINFWGADFPDSDSFYSIFLSNSGLNRYAWKNSKYDELVTRARSHSSRKDREKAYFSAQRILLEEEVATIPLYYGRISGLVRTSVKGFNPGAMDWWVFKDLSLK